MGEDKPSSEPNSYLGDSTGVQKYRAKGEVGVENLYEVMETAVSAGRTTVDVECQAECMNPKLETQLYRILACRW